MTRVGNISARQDPACVVWKDFFSGLHSAWKVDYHTLWKPSKVLLGDLSSELPESRSDSITIILVAVL